MKYRRLFIGFLVADVAILLFDLYLRSIPIPTGIYMCPAITGFLSPDVFLWTTPCFIHQTIAFFDLVTFVLLIFTVIVGVLAIFERRKKTFSGKRENQPKINSEKFELEQSMS
ncbi:MAG: hypothetical protein JRN20_07850 [Nitrososphaerota archaeon]|nr:hypothetical protein [Nitrososphaerota archaeon]